MNSQRCVLLCAALAVLVACGSKHPEAAPDAATPGASSMPDPTLSTPSADGVPISWRQYGHGEPAVVLIHGWAADSTIWRAQLAPLAARYRVVTLDLAGAGASGANRRNWTLAHFAQDVVAVVAKLPNAQVVLVGAGLGGPVALEAAPGIGPRLTGIIGVETFRTLGLAPPSPSLVEHELQAFHSDFQGAVRRYVGGTLFHPQADPALVRRVADLMAQAPAERSLAQLAELNRLDYGSILPAVKVPIVVVDSDLGGALDAARLEHAAPHLRVITMTGDDSFAMLDDAQRFNTTLQQAIASLGAQ